eukprot:SAG25_NODE_272_length_10613_cov_6.416191_22_plen_44_part_00
MQQQQQHQGAVLVPRAAVQLYRGSTGGLLQGEARSCLPEIVNF